MHIHKKTSHLHICGIQYGLGGIFISVKKNKTWQHITVLYIRILFGSIVHFKFLIMKYYYQLYEFNRKEKLLLTVLHIDWILDAYLHHVQYHINCYGYSLIGINAVICFM
eukprot:132977_1